MPTNWFEAFQRLIEFLEASKEKRKVIFFDELPWFDTAKSDFMPSLEHFWNSWASYRNDVVLVVCGSAASWMINELINHKGGLHNRLTARIRLEPFTLKEAEVVLKDKNSAIDRRDHVINLCEIKFSQQKFTITKEYAAQLERKIAIFKADTATKKAVWLTMLTTFGLHENEYSRRLVQKSLTMDVLFN